MPTWPSRRQHSNDNLEPSIQPSNTTPTRLQSIFPTLSLEDQTRHRRSKSLHNPEGELDEALHAKGHAVKGKSLGSSPNQKKAGKEVPEAPFISGTCITCNTCVKWPSNLRVFRCTICMTLNDVFPPRSPNERKGFRRQGPSVDEGDQQPLSLKRTRTIAEACTANFIKKWRICQAPPSYPPPPPPPPGMPLAEYSRQVSQYEDQDSHDWLNSTSQLPASELLQFAFPDDDPLALDNSMSSDGELIEKTPSPITTKRFKFPPPSHSPPPPPIEQRHVQTAAHSVGGKLASTHNSSSDDKTSLAVALLNEAQKRAKTQKELTASMFKPLEDYINHCFSKWEYINNAFHKPRLQEYGELPQTLETPRLQLKAETQREQKKRNKQDFRTPDLELGAIKEFYSIIRGIGTDIVQRLKALSQAEDENNMTPRQLEKRSNTKKDKSSASIGLIADIEAAKDHLETTLISATESLLRRPRHPFYTPAECKPLLIILMNPLLRHKRRQKSSVTRHAGAQSRQARSGGVETSLVLKRIFGLLSNMSNDTHHYIVTWLSWLPEPDFRALVELAGSFVTYRLSKYVGPKPEKQNYENDWQLKAASRVYALLFAANSLGGCGDNLAPGVTGIRRYRPILAVSDFYNSMLDYADLISDFDAWEQKSPSFCFCQYPFLLSMGSKITILEHDAKRQMEVQARGAFFDSIGLGRPINQYLNLRVRRDCLVEDSLKGISEGVGGGAGEIKKGLRIEFAGEDGIDAGGLKKEWFLLLARDVFDPNNGLFVYDDESHYAYFNPYSFEVSEQFYLVGVLLGLAIYNSTILDIAFPLVVFKKLLASKPIKTPLNTTNRVASTHTLEDLATLRPSLARGLRQLLEYEGDVEKDICRDFVVEVEKYGATEQIPLVPNGQNIPVTNENRHEFVDLYIQYILDQSVAKQFEPFKRGFYTVCGGNALLLFRPEEIELLIRGSDEPLDVDALRAVAQHDGWGEHPERVPVIRWFWDFFRRISPKQQRMLLTFITGSDRIPATGIANLSFRIVCIGMEQNRYPVARTCFNSIALVHYHTREKLERMLWRAMVDSEGFGLK